jgi:hypothetical protein
MTIVVAGSLAIMSNLNDNMMPPAELMDLHMQHCPASQAASALAIKLTPGVLQSPQWPSASTR